MPRNLKAVEAALGSKGFTRVERGNRWLVAAAVVALSVLAGGVGVWAFVRSGDRDAKTVQRLYRSGKQAEARALARWRTRSPDAPEAQLWRARFALADRNFPEADDALRRARALHAPGDELRRVSSIADALLGRFEVAEPVLRAAFNEDRTPDPLLAEALARVYLETYDLPRARVALKRWMLEAPRDAKPYLWRAEIDARTGDSAAVLADYREALQRDPDSPKARFGLADGLRQAHRNAEAAEAYAAYLKLKPDDPTGHLGAGRNAAEQGDADAARRHLERAIALAPNDAEAHRVLADLLTRRGDFDGALVQYDRAVALDPYDLEARHGRALVSSRLGRTAEAERDRAEATRLRADLRTLQTAQTTLVSAPQDRDAQLAVTRWLFEHGKGAEAVRWAESILRVHPGQPDACRLLADHYARTGQPGLANFYRAQTAFNTDADTAEPSREP